MMLNKQKRIINQEAIEKARKEYCEVCYKYGQVHVHHIKTRGSGGDDISDNLISLCGTCHTKAHAGNISKEKLYKIVRER